MNVKTKTGRKGVTNLCSVPMLVTTIYCYHADSGLSLYAVCPKCNCTVEREYQNYCDRCGQALNWQQYHRAMIVLR